MCLSNEMSGKKFGEWGGEQILVLREKMSKIFQNFESNRITFCC